jgi:hypothetical protein
LRTCRSLRFSSHQRRKAINDTIRSSGHACRNLAPASCMINAKALKRPRAKTVLNQNAYFNLGC